MEKEKIIEIIKNLSEKKGSAITRREFLGDSRVYLKHFSSWNEALESAGFQRNMLNGLTDDELLLHLKKFKCEFGRIPKSSEFDKLKGYPDSTTYRRRFGSWNKALLLVDFELNSVSKRFEDNSIDSLIELFKNEYIKINPQGFRDYDKKRGENAPSSTYLKKKLGKNWNELLRYVGLEVYKEHIFDIERAYESIREYIEKFGKSPSTSEFDKFLLEENKGFSVENIRKNEKLGTWNEFLKSLGFETHKTPKKILDSKEEIKRKYIYFSESIGAEKGATSEELERSDIDLSSLRLRFGGLNGLRLVCGYPSNRNNKKYTKEEIKKILKIKYKEYGRKLTNNEAIKDSEIPSLTVICSYFCTTKMSEVWAEIEKELKI